MGDLRYTVRLYNLLVLLLRAGRRAETHSSVQSVFCAVSAFSAALPRVRVIGWCLDAGVSAEACIAAAVSLSDWWGLAHAAPRACVVQSANTARWFALTVQMRARRCSRREPSAALAVRANDVGRARPNAVVPIKDVQRSADGARERTRVQKRATCRQRNGRDAHVLSREMGKSK
eukprot:IDg3699t1